MGRTGQEPPAPLYRPASATLQAIQNRRRKTDGPATAATIKGVRLPPEKSKRATRRPQPCALQKQAEPRAPRPQQGGLWGTWSSDGEPRNRVATRKTWWFTRRVGGEHRVLLPVAFRMLSVPVSGDVLQRRPLRQPGRRFELGSQLQLQSSMIMIGIQIQGNFAKSTDLKLG